MRKIYLRDIGYIPNLGINPDWNVSIGLEDLQGLMEGALLLNEKLDKQLVSRDTGIRPLPNFIGIAICATTVTAYTVEIALKTLFALTKPKETPPHSHNLLFLYDQLEQSVQKELDNTYKTMQPIGQPFWRDTNSSIRQIISTGSDNFVGWRYHPEKKNLDNGIPKALINVAEAVRLVTLNRLFPQNMSMRKTNHDHTKSS